MSKITGINISVADCGCTGYNLEVLSMSQTGRYTVAGGLSSFYSYSSCDLDIINMEKKLVVIKRRGGGGNFRFQSYGF